MEEHLQCTLQVGEQPLDVAWHPTEPLLATALIDGGLAVHALAAGGGAPAERLRLRAHKAAARAVCFSADGALVLTGSADRSILAVDSATGAPSARKKAAHDAGVNVLCPAGGPLTAAGDDAGGVRLWDARAAAPAASYAPHADFVADLAAGDAPGGGPPHLLSVGGDGTLAAVDLRALRLVATSEGDADDELTSVALLKRGRKVVCGSAAGVLASWSWGDWADCSDRFPGHPDSVAALAAVDDDTVLTGGGDGLIRVLSVQPNRMLGVLGGHPEGMDVERLALWRGAGAGGGGGGGGGGGLAPGARLASISHDAGVRVWDLALLLDDGSDADEGEAREGAAAAAEEEGGAAAAAAAAAAGGGGDSDSDGDGGGGGGRAAGKKKKRRKAKGAHRIDSGKQQKSAAFFSGLL